MSRMDLEADEGLRRQGWRVFRSASRDRVVPGTGAGARLVRVKIAEAAPVVGVSEGESISLEDRQVRVEGQRVAAERAERFTGDQAVGLSKVVHATCVSVTGNPDPVLDQDELFEVGIAPFDGFITEMLFLEANLFSSLPFAIRTSGGQTMFQSRQFGPVFVTLPTIEPDYFEHPVHSGGRTPFELRNMRVPIVSGESIFVVLREPPLFLAGQTVCNVMLVCQAYVIGNLGARSTVSAYRALTAGAAEANREALANQARLNIERERTAQIGAKLAAERQLIADRLSASLALQRAGPVVGAPRVARPPVAPVEGTGKTFVGAWSPSVGSIGYLIPDPPRGGRVTVFDSKYTIWDISGKNVGSGVIQPIRSDGDIPPGARLSPVRGGVLSGAFKPSGPQGA